jgi:putative transposase
MKLTRRLWDKIKHIRDDLHWKTAATLTKNYETILIGNLSTIRIVSNKTSVLTDMTKQKACIIGHYLFLQRLRAKAEEHNSTVIVVDESYTSKTCGKCFERNQKLGSAKVFECPNKECKFVWGRDQNAARNIALKHFGLFE